MTHNADIALPVPHGVFVKEGDNVVFEGKTSELGLPHHPGLDDIAVDDPHLDGPDDGWRQEQAPDVRPDD